MTKSENKQTEEEKSLLRCLDQAMDNAAEFLSFIRMKNLEDEFSSFQEALVEHERLKKLFKEKVDD